MKKPKAVPYKPTLLQLHPYGMEIAFVWSPDEQAQFAKWCSGLDSDEMKRWGEFVADTEWECRGMTWAAGNMDLPSVVGVNLPLFIKNGLPLSSAMGTLSHEVFHIIMALSRNIHEIPEFGHDEPMAYMTGYIMGHAMDIMPAKWPTLKSVVGRAAR